MHPGFQAPWVSSPVLAAVPTSNPAIQGAAGLVAGVCRGAHVEPGLPAASLPVPRAAHASIPPGSLAPRPLERARASWALGLVTAFLLLALLIAGGAWLVSIEARQEEPPPMPSARPGGHR